jgi:hypothetical protein
MIRIVHGRPWPVRDLESIDGEAARFERGFE